MLPLLLSLVASGSWIEYPPITIYPPTVTAANHTKRTFKTLTAAKPYITAMVGDSKKSTEIINKLKYVARYSVDINSMNGDPGSTIVRSFGRNHILLSIQQNKDGSVVTDIAKVNVNCQVHAQLILHIEETKKKLFGLIRKHSTSVLTQWRPLSAAEITQIYDVMNQNAQTQLQQAIAKVKSDN